MNALSDSEEMRRLMDIVKDKDKDDESEDRGSENDNGSGKDSNENNDENGLNSAQALGIQKEFDAMAIEMAKEKGLALQEQNTNFDKLAKDVFGADRDKALATAKGLIDTFTPPAMKGEVAKLSNENLVILAGILNGIHAKYIKTDGAPPGPGNGSGGETPETLRAQARALMASKAYTDSMDAEHMNVRKQVDEVYRRASGVNK